MRPTLRLALVLAGLALVMAASAAPVAARHAGTCPDGGYQAVQFLDEEGNVIWASVEMFPSLLRAFEDGIYTPEELAAGIAALDRNGNGILCAKDIWAHNGGRGAPPEPEQAQGLGGFYYFIQGIDDRAV